MSIKKKNCKSDKHKIYLIWDQLKLQCYKKKKLKRQENKPFVAQIRNSQFKVSCTDLTPYIFHLLVEQSKKKYQIKEILNKKNKKNKKKENLLPPPNSKRDVLYIYQQDLCQQHCTEKDQK